MRVLALALSATLLTAAVTPLHATTTPSNGQMGGRYNVVLEVWKQNQERATGETFWYNKKTYPTLQACEEDLASNPEIQRSIVALVMGMSQEWETKVSFSANCRPLSPSGERPA